MTKSNILNGRKMKRSSVDMAFGAFRTTMLAVILLTTFTCINGEEEEGRTRISEEEEDIEFERQLSILNKPAIKTIKTEYGDVYNCVDIYKQPAFDHPLLKDHKIQIPEEYASKPSKFGLKEGCPQGTVPIRRMTKEDLKRAKSISKSNRRMTKEDLIKSFSKRNVVIIDPQKQGDGHEFAGFETIKTPGRVYHGAGANINVYNPAVQPEEFSSAMISIESGPLYQRNYIQFGWTVDPSLYGDSKTRLFTSWTKDNHLTTGCFNTLCGGFVHFNANVPLDFVFTNISQSMGEQFDVRLGVYQHNITKVWNFVIGDEEELIGYWPADIFSHLSIEADYIRWGGQVYSPNSEQHSAQMGSGVWRDGWYQETCYFRRVIDLDATYTPEVPNNAYIQRSDTRCYYADDNSYKDDYWQYSFGFGGTGGSPHQCRR
ncbi:uncharacterized protein LOC122085486 [Macadamia integrifolia]|uniref:uncharacterized protein LOC122085486 n=1 Tax=Macadamia integrifolia TaxID=60698 RepID=UPI001C4FABDB|nr:uncharacterized protein LOC122085486 [Macadamia integrifolia]